jgi:predicted dehydrogenase
LSAGKHVYVEKPIANTIEECQVMAAARRYGRVVQVGQWQRSGPHHCRGDRARARWGVRVVKVWAYQGDETGAGARRWGWCLTE